MNARTNVTIERKTLGFGVGGLAVVFASMGVAAIVYGTGIMSFNPYNILAWLFGPLGVYTVVHSLATAIDSTYYLVWGTIMLAVAVVSGFYDRMSVFLVIGVLLIVLVIIGLAGYWRSNK